MLRIVLFAGCLGLASLGSGSLHASDAAAASSASTTAASKGDASATLEESDFLVDGVPFAKVLYLDGNVWIRQPTDSSFHLLREDEPIAADSIIYTGLAGTLDFAPGPGMAVRMVPSTLIRVALLPQPATATAPTTANPETCAIGVKKGTIFSALGREDSGPIDYSVRTPEGVAGARGTMFSTTASATQTEVNMLHGTVNFETPDHKTSQITVGRSQQISTSGQKYQFGEMRTMKPEKSEEFFGHAGGLLEHASGYGVVRHGLGPDVAKTLHEHGYALSSTAQQRFQRSSTTHFDKPRPAFNRGHLPKTGAGGTGAGAHRETGAGSESHPGGGAATDDKKPAATSSEREKKTTTTRPTHRWWDNNSDRRDKLGR